MAHQLIKLTWVVLAWSAHSQVVKSVVSSSMKASIGYNGLGKWIWNFTCKIWNFTCKHLIVCCRKCQRHKDNIWLVRNMISLQKCTTRSHISRVTNGRYRNSRTQHQSNRNGCYGKDISSCIKETSQQSLNRALQKNSIALKNNCTYWYKAEEQTRSSTTSKDMVYVNGVTMRYRKTEEGKYFNTWDMQGIQLCNHAVNALHANVLKGGKGCQAWVHIPSNVMDSVVKRIGILKQGTWGLIFCTFLVLG
uniref:Uncharacterized protein n=1 Tax=Nicotiana tabacum TaxID=4097 RepID=A0A1S3Z5J0_TOBAC|nr:PREDICTED: uncharacterized protein LOC107783200 [Nicotiana tabacum]